MSPNGISGELEVRRMAAARIFFIHRLVLVLPSKSLGKIVRVRTGDLAVRFGKATRSRPLTSDELVHPHRSVKKSPL